MQVSSCIKSRPFEMLTCTWMRTGCRHMHIDMHEMPKWEVEEGLVF